MFEMPVILIAFKWAVPETSLGWSELCDMARLPVDNNHRDDLIYKEEHIVKHFVLCQTAGSQLSLIWIVITS